MSGQGGDKFRLDNSERPRSTSPNGSETPSERGKREVAMREHFYAEQRKEEEKQRQLNKIWKIVQPEIYKQLTHQMKHPIWGREQHLTFNDKFLSEEQKQFLTNNPRLKEEYGNRVWGEVQRLTARKAPGAWVDDTLRQRIQ